MRLLCVGLLVGFGLVPATSLHAQSNEEAVEAAKQEAREWLALYDAEDYDSTWAAASAYGDEQWVETVPLKKDSDEWRVAGYFMRPRGQQ